VEATETERRRIAADLHDGPIQRLTTLTLSLERLKHRVEAADQAAAVATAADLQERLADEITSIRGVMASLRPPALDEKGLGAAIRDLAGAFERRTGTLCTVEACHDERLEPDVETVLYRVTQEILANVARHAQASAAGVALSGRTGSRWRWDDGVGSSRRRRPSSWRTDVGSRRCRSASRWPVEP
jgi:signal transduction histidine kinase